MICDRQSSRPLLNKNCIYYTPWETAAARGFLRPKQVRFIRPGFFKRDAAQYSLSLLLKKVCQGPFFAYVDNTLFIIHDP